MSRTSKSAINSVVGMLFNLLSALSGFVLQAVFVRLLGFEYAGINTLFSDVLSILNLADLGFSNAILFRLYKSIKDNDDARTELLLSSYRKMCYLIGGVILVTGFLCMPFLDVLIKDAPQFSESLWSLFIIVLVTSSVSQAISYRSIYLVAKQERYFVTIVQYTCAFLCSVLQIAVLVLFHNIYLYLLVKLFTTILSGAVLAFITTHKYNIKWRSRERLKNDEITDISKDLGTLSVYKLCRTIDASVDTFVITKFVSTVKTAIYGSALLVINSIQDLLCQVNDGMIASVGDLNASGDKNAIHSIFKISFHYTYLSFGTCAAVISVFLTPLMNWWINGNLSDIAIWVIAMNVLMYGFGMNIATFRNAMGLFKKGWIRPAVTALLNVIFSVLLVKKFGIVGPLLGTVISRGVTTMWYDPYIVLKYGMDKKPWNYFFRYLLYTLFTVLTSIILFLIKCQLPQAVTFFALLWQGALYSVVALGILLLLGSFIPEQKDVLLRIFGLLKNVIKKLKIIR